MLISLLLFFFPSNPDSDTDRSSDLTERALDGLRGDENEEDREEEREEDKEEKWDSWDNPEGEMFVPSNITVCLNYK